MNNLNQFIRFNSRGEPERYSVSIYNADGNLEIVWKGMAGGFGDALNFGMQEFKPVATNGRSWLIANLERGNLMHLRTEIQVEVIG